MPRFVIEKVADGDTVPPNVPGHRVTVTLPEQPNPLLSWGDLVKWFTNHPDVPHTFHLAILAIIRAFFFPSKPG